MERVLIVDADKCVGGQVCELVCSMKNHGEFNPKKSYIRVVKNDEMDIIMVALRPECKAECQECVEWCLSEAIRFVPLEEAILKWKGTKVGSLPAPFLPTQL